MSTPATTTPAPQKKEMIAGSYTDAEELNRDLDRIRPHANVLSPLVRIYRIPRLHEVVVNFVKIDPTLPEKGEAPRDVYLYDKSRQNQLSLTKHALDLISMAAGISWDSQLSGRRDDRSDPYYCWYVAVGWMRDFFNHPLQIFGEKESDFRDGSDQMKGWTEMQIRQARSFILAQSISKAMNAAIRRALGLRSSYTPEELRRPFAVPRLIFTGKVPENEPNAVEVQARIDLMITQAAQSATSALFGPESSGAPAQVGGPMRLVSPPPIESVVPAAGEPARPEVQGQVLDGGRGKPRDCGCPDAPAGKHEAGCDQAKPAAAAPPAATDDEFPFN